MAKQSILLSMYFDPLNAVKRALDARLHGNIHEVRCRADKKSAAIVLQVRRTDGEAIHVHLPVALFHDAETFTGVVERDPTLMAKLILFLA